MEIEKNIVNISSFDNFTLRWSRRGRDRMVVGFTIPMQSVPITTNVVSSNPTQ